MSTTWPNKLVHFAELNYINKWLTVHYKFQTGWLPDNNRGKNRKEYKVIHFFCVCVCVDLPFTDFQAEITPDLFPGEVPSPMRLVPEPSWLLLLPVYSPPSPLAAVGFAKVGVSSSTSETKGEKKGGGVSLVNIGAEIPAGDVVKVRVNPLVWSLIWEHRVRPVLLSLISMFFTGWSHFQVLGYTYYRKRKKSHIEINTHFPKLQIPYW